MTVSMPIQPCMVDAALAFAARGCPVFPCDPDNKRPFRGTRGFKDATTNADTIRSWWSQYSNALIGMPTGAASGIWVLDIDAPDLFEANCPIALPETLRVDTGKGYHLYFKFDPDRPVHNTQRSGNLWPMPSLQGAETRGEGGYVIVPPSRHPEGRRYQWHNTCTPASATDELLKLVWERHTKSSRKASNVVDSLSGQDTKYGLKALEYEAAAIRTAGNGEQESTLNKAALKIGGLVAGGELSMATAKGRLLVAGRAMPHYNPTDPWTTEAITAKVERGLADGTAKPRRAPERETTARSQPSNPSQEALGSAATESVDDRRERQRRENREIGEGTNEIPRAKIVTLDQMLEEYVFIKQGSQVAPLGCPKAVLALPDFKNAMAGSKHWVRPENEKPKSLKVVDCWLEHQDRMEADELTFRAGGNAIVPGPRSGLDALNLWAPFARSEPPVDWADRAAPFIEHVRWLWGEDADKFLDWLAHIEQYPGVLPHYGWVHISRQHGKGRNWISSVLTRVWRGYVAASLDLVAMLESKFNEEISLKIMAIVDEINEGGVASYRHAQALRQMVTAEFRPINPKYGRKHIEYNSCRWLMFSNHAGAIPLDDGDRRFWIVSHEGEAKEAAYYQNLYGQLLDGAFISSVTKFLQERSIQNFNPGEHPPLNEAKARLISVSQNEDHLTLKEIAENWPIDVITNHEITSLLESKDGVTAGIRRAMGDLDFSRIERRVKVVPHGPQRVYSIRNHSTWQAASHEVLKREIESLSENQKREAIGRGL